MTNPWMDGDKVQTEALKARREVVDDLTGKVVQLLKSEIPRPTSEDITNCCAALTQTLATLVVCSANTDEASDYVKNALEKCIERFKGHKAELLKDTKVSMTH